MDRKNPTRQLQRNHKGSVFVIVPTPTLTLNSECEISQAQPALKSSFTLRAHADAEGDGGQVVWWEGVVLGEHEGSLLF